jgi:hypothetical protein
MKRLAGEGSLVPELEEGEEDYNITAREWELKRAFTLRAGKDNAPSRGGRKKDKNEVTTRIQTTVSEIGVVGA